MLLSFLNPGDAHRIVYVSRARPTARADLAAILTQSRANNFATGISGALCLHDGHFMQCLEGAPEKVEAAYAQIESDPRHSQLRLLCRQKVDHRWFHGLRMGLLTWNLETRQLFQQHLQSPAPSLHDAPPEQLLALLQALSKSASWSEV